MKDKQSIIQILKNKKIKMRKKIILDQFEIENKLESLKIIMKTARLSFIEFSLDRLG